MLLIYSKSRQEDLTRATENFAKTREGELKMNKREFEKLVASVKQPGKIKRGEMKASRIMT
jgi:hypothetical protein